MEPPIHGQIPNPSSLRRRFHDACCQFHDLSHFPAGQAKAGDGLFGITIMSPPAFGPLLNGYFVEYATWRLSFYINVPIGAVAMALTAFVLYDFPHEANTDVDVWGFLLSCAGFFLLLFGVNNVASDGWMSFTVIGSIIAEVFLLVALIVVELRAPVPLIVKSDNRFSAHTGNKPYESRTTPQKERIAPNELVERIYNRYLVFTFNYETYFDT
jgi:hypothetical protein